MTLDSGILTFGIFWVISAIVWFSSLEFRLKQMRTDLDKAMNMDSNIISILDDIKNRLVRVETLLETKVK